jgi:hypothetical protein
MINDFANGDTKGKQKEKDRVVFLTYRLDAIVQYMIPS